MQKVKPMNQENYPRSDFAIHLSAARAELDSMNGAYTARQSDAEKVFKNLSNQRDAHKKENEELKQEIKGLRMQLQAAQARLGLWDRDQLQLLGTTTFRETHNASAPPFPLPMPNGIGTGIGGVPNGAPNVVVNGTGAVNQDATSIFILQNRVMSQLKALNDQIARFATTAGDSLVWGRKSHKSKEEYDENYKEVESCIGKQLAFALSQQPKKEAGVNALLARLVTQVLLVRICYRKIDVHSQDGARVLVGEVYETPEYHQAQWQAPAFVTNPGPRGQTPLPPPNDISLAEARDAFQTVFRLPSWIPSDTAKFEQHLSLILKAAQDLRGKLSGRPKRFASTSASLEVRIVRLRGLSYDPLYMEEGYSDWRTAAVHPSVDDRVVATLGLGLVKITPPRAPSECLRHELIVKPKVLVESGLKEAESYLSRGVAPERQRRR